MFGSKQTRLCAAFFVLGACVSLVVTTLVKSLPALHRSGLQTSSVNVNQTIPGPCGKIEAIEIPLANPDGIFPDREERLAVLLVDPLRQSVDGLFFEDAPAPWEL